MARVDIDGATGKWTVKGQEMQLNLTDLGAENLSDIAKFLLVAGAARISFERGTGAKATDETRTAIAAKILADPVDYFTPTEREARAPKKSIYEVEALRRFTTMSRAVGDNNDPNNKKAVARWRELGGPDKRSGAEFQKFRSEYITALAPKLEADNWKPASNF